MGKKIQHRNSFAHLIEREVRPSCNLFEGDHTSSLEHIKQEYPSYGTTDYRYPAHMLTNQLGSKVSNFKYKESKISLGKPKLKDLPGVYVEESSEAQTLQVTLFDDVLNCELVLSYTIFEDKKCSLPPCKIYKYWR
ncbi:MAG: hypothetical protein LRY71_16580 [Bacillaceae bacterium]|nr:hypothetical protein [Bacillaceae bacterium]